MSESLKFSSNALGTTLAGTPASLAIAIPTDANGVIPRRLYLATTADMQFLPAQDDGGTPTAISGATAVSAANGILLKTQQPMVILSRGFTHLLTIGIAGTEFFVMAPVED